jgi:hypothetical protein
MTRNPDDDDDDPEAVMVLTPKGRAMLAADEDGTVPMNPRDALSLEVIRQAGKCAGWELDDYCDELIAAFGDDAKALAALRSGEARLMKKQ